MKPFQVKELSEFQKDALREIGNMGASHAANSLSKLLKSKIEATFPSLNIISIEQFPEVAGRGEERVTCICGRLGGGISGTAILLFPSDALEFKRTSDAQKTGNIMLSALANAMSGFFKSKVIPTSIALASDRVTALPDFLKKEIGKAAEEAIFFSSNFILSESIVCRFFLSLSAEDIDALMGAEVPEFAQEYRTLGEMVTIFERLSNIEVKLNDFIQGTKVKKEAARSFLRAPAGSLSREELYRILEALLVSSGIGESAAISSPSPLKYEFAIKNCNVCKIVPKQGVRSCYTTSTALGRFFLEVLKIGNEVQETKCTKIGDNACVHVVNLEQIDVFSILPEERDIKILRCLADGSLSSEEISRKTGISGNALRESFSTLERYGILKVSNGVAAVTELGQVFLTFAQGAPAQGAPAQPEKKVREPVPEKVPWEG